MKIIIIIIEREISNIIGFWLLKNGIGIFFFTRISSILECENRKFHFSSSLCFHIPNNNIHRIYIHAKLENILRKTEILKKIIQFTIRFCFSFLGTNENSPEMCVCVIRGNFFFCLKKINKKKMLMN